ncbi:MAG TPA: hypothetical protein VEW07_13125, partial [Solirubrobacterales bacterium]|nr:hypothetical protein [Solirubrobacterales bacterium]
MSVKSTITNTMIMQMIEIASIAVSNDFTCVWSGAKSIWRFPLPLSIMAQISSLWVPGCGAGEAG